MSEIAYGIEKLPAVAEVADLFRRSGIRRPVDDPDRIARMIANANFTICARRDGVLVGIARSLTDFSYCCYLSDLAVDRVYQREGIGRELVRRTQEALGEEVMILLIAAPEAKDYYPRIGFEWMDRAWFLPRKQ
jgi:N-acetylglutamate synthase-like GNAT family acetyltransferase